MGDKRCNGKCLKRFLSVDGGVGEDPLVLGHLDHPGRL